MNLPDEQRRALHRCMIDFVIQKRCILDSTFLKTWDIFRGIFKQFPFTPRQLLLEFHLRLLPNLSDYEINEFHVDYFEKIRAMNVEQRTKWFEEAVEEIKEICPEGTEMGFPPFEEDLPEQQQGQMPGFDGSAERYSTEDSNARGYDEDFMIDAQIYFSNFPSFPCRPVGNFLGFLLPCWEIRTLLKFYPQQFVTNFLCWRMRMQDCQIQEIRKRKATPGKTHVPAKKKK
uniref:Uncharacterized protein n=1 Tax=Lutzomyia longipalpis TaxID=7200 RepID=A0A1B0CP50_LUTLO